jgi:hypothetical protein
MTDTKIGVNDRLAGPLPAASGLSRAQFRLERRSSNN